MNHSKLLILLQNRFFQIFRLLAVFLNSSASFNETLQTLLDYLFFFWLVLLCGLQTLMFNPAKCYSRSYQVKQGHRLGQLLYNVLITTNQICQVKLVTCFSPNLMFFNQSSVVKEHQPDKRKHVFVFVLCAFFYVPFLKLLLINYCKYWLSHSIRACPSYLISNVRNVRDSKAKHYRPYLSVFMLFGKLYLFNFFDLHY